jgi:glutamyl/glutaminyl-tRNA synthetase
MTVCRFAPSTTGPAHPGTLLAALLCWLDARQRNARLILRLEDLDPERSTLAHAAAMVTDLAWFGLDWDVVERQSDHTARHHAALDHLAAIGALYPCTLSRSDLAAGGRRAPDGSWRCDNRNRGNPLPPGGWRACTDPLRARLPPGIFAPHDEGGTDLAQNPAEDAGDPIVRRRDGAIAYPLAVVVDDAAAGVDRIVRGRDLAPATATQTAFQHLLGLPAPSYRHHFLLLENRARKFAKFHGAVGAPTLRQHYRAQALCGLLAHAAGLRPDPSPYTPADLLADFTWDRVRRDDLPMTWTGSTLTIGSTDNVEPLHHDAGAP